MTRNQSVISGTVRDHKGQPVADARVYFLAGPVSLPDIAALTDMSEKFSLSAPAAGAYEIQCTAAGVAPTTLTVHVTSGQDAQVDIRLGN